MHGALRRGEFGQSRPHSAWLLIVILICTIAPHHSQAEDSKRPTPSAALGAGSGEVDVRSLAGRWDGVLWSSALSQGTPYTWRIDEDGAYTSPRVISSGRIVRDGAELRWYSSTGRQHGRLTLEKRDSQFVMRGRVDGSPMRFELISTAHSPPARGHIGITRSDADIRAQTVVDSETKARLSLSRRDAKILGEFSQNWRRDPCSARWPQGINVLVAVSPDARLEDKALVDKLLTKGRSYAVVQCGAKFRQSKETFLWIRIYNTPFDTETWSTTWRVSMFYHVMQDGAFKPGEYVNRAAAEDEKRRRLKEEARRKDEAHRGTIAANQQRQRRSKERLAEKEGVLAVVVFGLAGVVVAVFGIIFLINTKTTRPRVSRSGPLGALSTGSVYDYGSGSHPSSSGSRSTQRAPRKTQRTERRPKAQREPRQCPDCDDVRIGLHIGVTPGNGVCRHCHGGGVGGFADQLADATNPFGRGHIECAYCDGKGRCKTCRGKGVVR
jgi:hypothetical protein